LRKKRVSLRGRWSWYDRLSLARRPRTCRVSGCPAAENRRLEFLSWSQPSLRKSQSGWMKCLNSMAGVRDNLQLETQLLTEWWSTLPRGWPNKTHVNVGAIRLMYQGNVLTPAMQRAFGVWNDWADMRIFTGVEVWVVEAKIVNTGSAYGQLLDYCDEYPQSEDYKQFAPAPIVPVVVCAFERQRTALLYGRMGVRTVLFTPTWAGSSLAQKLYSRVNFAQG